MHQRSTGANKLQIDGFLLPQEHDGRKDDVVSVKKGIDSCICSTMRYSSVLVGYVEP